MDREIIIKEREDGVLEIYGFAYLELFGVRIGQKRFLKIGEVKKKNDELTFIPDYMLSSISTETMGDILNELTSRGIQVR
jgi:hypothetical protein